MPKSIGEILKNQRLDRKLSLDDVAAITHIRYKYLEALENNDFELLPSAVQGRGFLRSYAESLELDPNPLLRGWEQRSVVDIIEQKLEQPIQNIIDETSNSKFDPSLPVTQNNIPDEISDEENQAEVAPAQAQTPITPPVNESKSTTHFLGIGNTLLNQREILGLSISDIEQYTHIRQFYLQAIEDGRFQELPSPVQAKGMIENYAQFLDINSDELLMDFAEGLQAQREEKLALNNPPVKGKKVTNKPAQKVSNKLLTPDLLIGSIVIVFLVIFAIWTTSRVINNKNLEAQSTIPGISDVLVATSSPSPETQSMTTTLLPTVMETAIAAINTTSENTTGIQTEEIITNETLESTSTNTFEENAPLQINVIINQRTYLKIIADGKTAFEGRAQAGNAYPFSASDSIELISGNAESLQIIFNEVDMGTIGTFGQVVDLIFTGGSVITATPKFTMTPTNTPLPTMTLQPSSTLISPTITPYIP